MTAKIYIGINNTASRVKKLYIGVNGVARKVKKAYIGVNNIARLFYASAGWAVGSTTALSVARNYCSAVGNGTYALFAGGFGGYDSNDDCIGYATVDTYNTSLTRGTCTALSQKGFDKPCGTVGNYMCFLGGYDGNESKTTQCNAYNASLTRSTPTSLSAAFTNASEQAASVGNYIIVAGGGSYTTTTVNAYNTSLTRTIPTALSQGRNSAILTSVGKTYALVCGGTKGSGRSNKLGTVDAYNSSLTRSIPTALTDVRTMHIGASLSNYALIAAGSGATSGAYLSSVETYNTSLTKGTATSLTIDRCWPGSAVVNDKAIFAGGYDYNFTDVSAAESYDSSLTKLETVDLGYSGSSGISGTYVGNYALFAFATVANNIPVISMKWEE